MSANDSLNGFTIEQRKWIVARLLSTSDAAAARAVGVHPSTVCKWAEKPELDETIEALLADPMAQALTMILDAVPEAAKVKIAGLNSRKENVRQSSATEILDRVVGKPRQKMEHSGPEGEAIRVLVGGIDLANDV